ncbi:hypothetical protein AAFF_G00042000 [Aldrovandia affinis]|uniref:Uncharacterized protein n=1 Tax=Aldrovandia affinis TaxID=143900 RepID=A0AAD7WFN2_9TELE|nr:hypothetical protein AAFF_G00042000 [Aldrovandia affinis]
MPLLNVNMETGSEWQPVRPEDRGGRRQNDRGRRKRTRASACTRGERMRALQKQAVVDSSKRFSATLGIPTTMAVSYAGTARQSRRTERF